MNLYRKSRHPEDRPAFLKASGVRTLLSELAGSSVLYPPKSYNQAQSLSKVWLLGFAVVESA